MSGVFGDAEEPVFDDEPARAGRRLEDDPIVRMALPVGRSAWAIIAGYFGLISVLILPAPIAVVTGLLAFREIRRNPKLGGRGRAAFALVMGIPGTILLLVAAAAVAYDILDG